MHRRVLVLCVLLVSSLVTLSAAAQQAGLSLHQIAQTRAATQAEVSPDGRHIAYVLSVPREPGVDDDGAAWTRLHLVDMAGNDHAYIEDKSGVGAIAWMPDGSAVTFVAKREGDTHRSLYAIPRAGGGPRALARLEGRDIRAYSVSPDGRQAAVLALPAQDKAQEALRKQGFTQKVYEEDWWPIELWVVGLDEASVAPRQISIQGSVQDVQWSPAGDRLALKVAPRELVDDTLVRVRVHIVGLDGRERGRVDNPGKLGEMAWSPDGGHLALISAEDVSDPREGRLTVVGRDGGAQRDLVPGLEGHIWQLAWRDARRIVFVSQEGVQTRLAEVAVDGSAARTLVAGGGPIWSDVSLGAAGDIALVGNAPSHPGEVFRVPRNGGAPKRLTDSNPWLAQVRLARQEVVRYAARDGLEIEGVLFHPLERAAGARVPLILVVHGGPEAHHSNGWLTNYSQPAQHAAARGFAVFFPNYRASTGRGVAFSKLDHGRPAKEEFDDLVDGVDHLVERGLVDRDKVGITGSSYGGYATAWGATYYSERFAAAVMNVGISDKISMLGTGDIPHEMHRVHYQTWPWENWQMFEEASPLRYLTRARTPILILHGDADPRVDPTQSRILYRYLKLIDQAPVRLVLYPGEGHGNQRAASRWDYSLRLMQWMEHYLMGPGGEPPAYRLDYRLPEAEKQAKDE